MNTPTLNSNQTLMARMKEEMYLRNMTRNTQRDYLRNVQQFTDFYGADIEHVQAEDVRRYQLFLTERGCTSATINAALSGLSFLFKRTLNRPDVMHSQPIS